MIPKRKFINRGQANEAALAENLHRLRRTRLADESAKLDPLEERRLAEEGLGETLAGWPE